MKTVRRGPPTELSPQAREILAKRALRIARKRRTSDEGVAAAWLASFRVGDEIYAIPLDIVRAVAPLKQVTAVPMAPPHLIGIMRFRERILPVLSLVSLLGVHGWSVDPTVLVVVEIGAERLVVVDCEEIPRAISLPVSVLEEARASTTATVVDVTTPQRRQIRLIDDFAGIVANARGDHRGV